MSYKSQTSEHDRPVFIMFPNFSRVLKCLYNKDPSLGILLFMMGLSGVWHPELQSVKSRLKFILFCVIMAFFSTIYIKFAMNLSLESFKVFLQHTPFHLGVVKNCYFQKDYKAWEELVRYVSSVERKEMAQKDAKITKILKEYTSRSRNITIYFFLLAYFSNFAIFSEPYQKNEVTENGSVYNYLFEGYTPFRKEHPGYYYSMFFQTIFGYIMSFYIVCWDMTTVTIMIFITGQLRLCGVLCSRVIDVKSTRNSLKNIAECHDFHTKLVLYQQKFNALISPVMCFYIFIISVNLGVCIIQLNEIKGDLTALISSCVYIGAILIQLLMFYWHSNEVTVESQRVSYNTFKSQWVDVDWRLQRQVLLLAWTTQKRLAFRAGPFNEMSLATFISILRGSYSFYTLLEGTN